VIRDVQKMLRRLVGQDVELTTELVGSEESAGDETADDLVHADRGQIEQVVVNLCVNARDAMPEGGRLTVSVSRTLLDGGTCERLDLSAGAYVRLSVTDTGHGMDADTAARIFEPFFTTKEAGKGTGLGLATVYAIVKQSGGAIAVDTAPGRGTTFALYFPLVQAMQDTPDEVTREVETGHGTVLVVEDEAPVRAIVRRTLEREGYAVLDAASGVQALELLREHRGTIDVLLTDVMMPGLNGVALSQAVVRQRPSMRVLFMSGHPGDTFARHGLDVSSARLLQKPFSTESLCRELQGVLAAPAH
jgi:CheY-like chemotaxis protein